MPVMAELMRSTQQAIAALAVNCSADVALQYPAGN
jgi:hypothetical protein